MKKKCKTRQEILVEEILPFSNGKRLLNSDLGKSWLLKIGEEKILLNLGSGCLTGLIGKLEARDVDVLVILSPLPEASADVFPFLNYRYKTSYPSPVKPIYVLGYPGLNSNLKLMSELYLWRNSDNTLGVVNLTGILEHNFSSRGITIKTFQVGDGPDVGCSIIAYGKKISFLPFLDINDFILPEFIKNSDCLIVSDCKIKAEEISDLREFKRKNSIANVLISATDCSEHLCKYKAVSFCQENKPFKIGDFVDNPSIADFTFSKDMTGKFFIKIETKDFYEESSYLIPKTIGVSQVKDFNGKRVRFIKSSEEFKRRFAGKEEDTKNSNLVIGEIKNLKSIDDLYKIIKPIRFFDLMYLISNDLLSKEKHNGFFLVDKFNNSQLVLLYPLPGEWEICDNVEEEDLGFDINFISAVKP